MNRRTFFAAAAAAVALWKLPLDPGPQPGIVGHLNWLDPPAAPYFYGRGVVDELNEAQGLLLDLPRVHFKTTWSDLDYGWSQYGK